MSELPPIHHGKDSPEPEEPEPEPVIHGELHMVELLAEAMRAVGAGRARFGDIELDLTVPPLAGHRSVAAGKRDNELDLIARQRASEAEAERRESILFRASAGRRPRLPMGG